MSSNTKSQINSDSKAVPRSPIDGTETKPEDDNVDSSTQEAKTVNGH